jgi:hypothetical protein
MRLQFAMASVAICGIIFPTSVGAAGISWPADHFLPSFPAPAAVLDVVDVQSSKTWQAEGTDFSHPTGHLDGNGWLCQTVIDPVGYMLVGPTTPGFTDGTGRVTFRILIDNKTQRNIDARQPVLRFSQVTATIRIIGGPGMENGTIAVYSAQGKRVLTSRAKASVSLRALPAGTYVAVFRQGRVYGKLRCVLAQ